MIEIRKDEYSLHVYLKRNLEITQFCTKRAAIPETQDPCEPVDI